MTNSIDITTKISSWLHKNYDIDCISCQTIVPGINLVLSAKTHHGQQYFIKIFNQERSNSSVENEGLVTNFLQLNNISATEALKSVTGKLSHFIAIEGQLYSALVFSKANGRACTLSDKDLTLCAKTLLKLHKITPIDINVPIFDINKKIQDMSKLSDLHFPYEPLKLHYKNLIHLIAIQRIPSRLSICHGDPRTQNIFIKNDQATFIDFEHYCLSSPCLDLAIMVWGLYTKSTYNSDYLDKIHFFIDAYNQSSAYHFTLKDLAPYVLLHEIWSIWFLIKHRLLTDQTALSITNTSYSVFSMLKHDLEFKS